MLLLLATQALVSVGRGGWTVRRCRQRASTGWWVWAVALTFTAAAHWSCTSCTAGSAVEHMSLAATQPACWLAACWLQCRLQAWLLAGQVMAARPWAPLPC